MLVIRKEKSIKEIMILPGDPRISSSCILVAVKFLLKCQRRLIGLLLAVHALVIFFGHLVQVLNQVLKRNVLWLELFLSREILEIDHFVFCLQLGVLAMHLFW